MKATSPTYLSGYGTDRHLNSLSVTNASTSALLFQSQRGYDAIGNVTAVATTLSAGTDNQAFCYDDQNRLVWAGSTGTPSCGASLTPGSLMGGTYTQTLAYDTLDRFTSGPAGSYTYSDAAHLHAVTDTGGSPGLPMHFGAQYDAAGDMTCRSSSPASSCTLKGIMLGYDNEGRLSTWQNAPTSPTSTDSFLYDGAGSRVEQLATQNAITTTTTYVAGGLEEISDNGTGSSLTKYFTGADGLPTAERVGTGGPLSYLATDGQGTVSEALDSSGNVTFQQLFDPYGKQRYATGSSPTSLGYTGQRTDSTTTGLDYYHARYYDPRIGQFISADTANDGLNRYGYVAGNPTTATDPTGHRSYLGDGGGQTIMGPVDCHTNNTCPTPTPTPTPQPPSTSAGGNSSGSCTGSDCRDKAGKCTNESTCDIDRRAAASALAKQSNDEGLQGKGLILTFLLVKFIGSLLGDNVAEQLKGFEKFIGVIDDWGGPVATFFFGSGSAIVGIVGQIVEAGNRVMGIIHALNGVMWLVGSAMTLIKALAGAPLNCLSQPY